MSASPRNSRDVDVAVVVVTYNSEHVIVGLLDSLPEALGDLAADIVVVDNDSTDQTWALLEGRDDCRRIRSANLGYAAGVNRGIRDALPAPSILVLNPDVRLGAKSVSLLRAALRDSGAGIVAPRVVSADGKLHHSLRREQSIPRAMGLNFTGYPLFSEYLGRDEEYDNPKIVDWALGAVLMFSRECLNAVGEWDESFFLYSEETDFCLRARDVGFVTRFEPQAVAEHIGGQSGQSAETHAMMVVNRVRMYHRRHKSMASWVYFALNVASELSWVARGNKNSIRSAEALLRPKKRPAQLGCSARILPK